MQKFSPQLNLYGSLVSGIISQKNTLLSVPNVQYLSLSSISNNSIREALTKVIWDYPTHELEKYDLPLWQGSDCQRKANAEGHVYISVES